MAMQSGFTTAFFFLICSICVYNFSVNGDLNHDKVAFLPSLKVGTFTTGAIDNINQYPSSNTATSSFHGTAILIFSIFLWARWWKGSARFSNKTKQKKLKKLPSYYTDIKPATLNKAITIQEPNSWNDTPNDIPSTKTSSNDKQEDEWLEYVAECIEKATENRLDLFFVCLQWQQDWIPYN